MARKATLKVYTGSEWQRVTGRIVKVYANGSVTIDDDRNVRHFATADRATVHAETSNDNEKQNTLW